MLVVADVFGHLLLEGGLDDLLGDRLQQPVRASQILTPGASGLDQLADRGALRLLRRERLLACLTQWAHAHQCVGHGPDPSR
jgi:hypothetical protein